MKRGADDCRQELEDVNEERDMLLIIDGLTTGIRRQKKLLDSNVISDHHEKVAPIIELKTRWSIQLWGNINVDRAAD